MSINTENLEEKLQDENKKKVQRAGYSLLKPIIVNFVRCVHILSNST